LTISSLGKTFSATGWKIGWAVGPAPLVTGVFRARQFITFAVASVLQWAAIEILQAPDSYFADLREMYQHKRDFLMQVLAQTLLKPLKPQGGYFVMADTSALGLADDRACTDYLIQEIGVASIPPASFYSSPNRHLAHHLTRFGICKTDDTLRAAAQRLEKLKRKETLV
jgi:N-succinyldiaminopimelate aminotransferase